MPKPEKDYKVDNCQNQRVGINLPSSFPFQFFIRMETTRDRSHQHFKTNFPKYFVPFQEKLILAEILEEDTVQGSEISGEIDQEPQNIARTTKTVQCLKTET